MLTPPKSALPPGEAAFLPAAYRHNGETPVYLEKADYTPAECGGPRAPSVAAMEVAGKPDFPLSNFDYAAYGEYPLHSGAAHTASGQEAMEVQGAQS